MNPGRDAHEVKKATIERFVPLWQKNFLTNKENISRKHGVREFFGKFRDIPAIVVGAGPSLDKNIKYLAYAKDRAVILSCDAALQALVKENIVPSFVVILDPQDFIAKFFQGIDTRHLTLIAPTIIHPVVLEFWEGRVCFYNKFAPDIPLLSQIERAANRVGSLTPGGSVLSVGYDFVFKAGCNPIIFAGQDLAYGDSGTHTKNSLYGGIDIEKRIAKERENIVFEKDMFGQIFPTQKTMSVTRTWFEWAFGTWKRDNPLEVINSTEGGVLINKCSLMPLSESVYRYCKRKINMNWTIRKILK